MNCFLVIRPFVKVINWLLVIRPKKWLVKFSLGLKSVEDMKMFAYSPILVRIGVFKTTNNTESADIFINLFNE